METITIIIILVILVISLICLSIAQNVALVRFKKINKELESYNKTYARAYRRAMRQTSLLLKSKKNNESNIDKSINVNKI